VQQLEIPSLATYGITSADVPPIVERALEASSMKANPLPLTKDELTLTLTEAL
jgi:alcohol dehydrogenase class IV